MSGRVKTTAKKTEKFLKTDVDEFWNDCLNYEGENHRGSDQEGSEQFLTCKNIFLITTFS